MKVTGIVGSPRKDGSTSELVSAVLAGAESNGAETQTFNLNELDITPCQSCYYCKENGKCKYEDDYVEIVKALDESDVFVIGSPVYFGEVTAQLKHFIDRLYSVVNNQGINNTKLVLVHVQANPDASLYEGYIEHQKNMLYGYCGFDIVDSIQAYGIPEKEDLSTNKTFLEKAKEIGSNL
ncbi:flavodoxin family protein [Methanobrevibacter filiformis]|uniref:Iron-sulfur flavoprotein n=1 Tax=Methanobrevibacter filiformis TaxID=55758 RepID=A0A166EIJ0_9EURY|nr:flavodoxin family protein [Methanobrevibacter filiformis]KZX16689.1 iron-sulfur flavoprotein [Methanobrevibacter filiformis]